MTRRHGITASTVVAMAAICVALGWYAVRSGALPADADDRERFQAASLDLTTGPLDAVISARNMIPGDTVTAALTITNSGPTPMTYGMRRGGVTAGGATLAAELVFTVKTVGSSCADFDGASLFEGPLDEAAFGTGRGGRPLPAATAEILCFRAALPLDAANAVQGSATVVTLSFTADSQAAAR
jgi:hypothetical protein